MFKIKIAGIVIGIYNKYEFVKRLCYGYIVQTDRLDFTVSVSRDDIIAEKQATTDNMSDGYFESICLCRSIANRLPLYDAFLLHAAVVEVDGEGYAFCAKSGIGKTTHIKLWQKLLGDKVTIINGDKPIVRVIDGEVFAFGSPWCGKEGYQKNDRVRLRAICFLEQSDGNKIHIFDKSSAAKKLIHQIIIPGKAENAAKSLELLDHTLSKTDTWQLFCNMDVEAAELSYKEMKK